MKNLILAITACVATTSCDTAIKSNAQNNSNTSQNTSADSAIIICEQYQVYLPEHNRCIWTGEAPPSVIGNIIIESLGIGVIRAAGGLLVSMGKKAITWGVTRQFGAVAVARTGGNFASIQSRVTSSAVRTQLATVHDDLVEEAIKHGNAWVGIDTPPLDISALNLVDEAWNSIHSVSLGTARKITERTGREVALLRSGGKNYLVLGNGIANVRLPANINSQPVKMIYHTHPELGNNLDEFLAMASQADEEVLLLLGQTQSFVVHGMDAITQFFAP